MCSTISVNSKSVQARVIDVSMVGKNVEFDKLENPISLMFDGHFEKLNRFTHVVVGESAKIDRIRIMFGRFQSENDEILWRRIDVTVWRH